MLPLKLMALSDINGFNAMFREFLVCFIIALLAVGFVGEFFLGAVAAIGKALGVVGNLLLGLIKIALVIVAVLVILAVIRLILEKLGVIKSKPKESDQAGEEEVSPNRARTKRNSCIWAPCLWTRGLFFPPKHERPLFCIRCSNTEHRRGQS